MMDMLWCVFSVSSIALNIESSIWDIVPSGLRFVSKHNVGTIVPLEPSPKSLGKHPGAHVIWTFMEPMVEWALETVSPSTDVSWEFALESGNHVIELQGVSAQMNPSRVGSEDSQSVSWPESVMLMPAGNIWLFLLHISDKVINIEFESSKAVFLLNVLLENSSPFFAGNIVVDMFSGSLNIKLSVNNLLGNSNVALKFLIRLVESVVKRSSLKVNNSCASLHVVDSGGKSNLGSESVASESCHSNLLIIHKSNNVCRDVSHSEALVMVGVTHVSVVNEPHISNIEDLAIFLLEELLEVFRWLNEVTEPNHGWEIGLLSLQESTSKLN